jgi:hypothetical protein
MGQMVDLAGMIRRTRAGPAPGPGIDQQNGDILVTTQTTMRLGKLHGERRPDRLSLTRDKPIDLCRYKRSWSQKSLERLCPGFSLI